MDEERGSDDVGLDDAMFRVIRIIGDVEGSCGIVNAKEWPADTMTEQRRAVMEAASGVMNNMVAQSMAATKIAMRSRSTKADGGRPDVVGVRFAFASLAMLSACAHLSVRKNLKCSDTRKLPERFVDFACDRSKRLCAIAVHRRLLSSYVGIVEALIAGCLLQSKSCYPHRDLLMINIQPPSCHYVDYRLWRFFC